jgi:hypothetical protein
VRVRERAPLELPHVMVLIDDPEHLVLDPLFARTAGASVRCSADAGQRPGSRLAGGASAADPVGGRAIRRGWRIRRLFAERYGVDRRAGVCCMPWATATIPSPPPSIIWENLKRAAPDPAAIMSHPARHALVELVNLHDEGLEFEAIHRVAFAVNATNICWRRWRRFARHAGSSLTVLESPSWAGGAAARGGDGAARPPCDRLSWQGSVAGYWRSNGRRLTLPVATLQAFLDRYLVDQPDARLDYIHGEDTLEQLGAQPGNMGFLFAGAGQGRLSSAPSSATVPCRARPSRWARPTRSASIWSVGESYPDESGNEDGGQAWTVEDWHPVPCRIS